MKDNKKYLSVVFPIYEDDGKFYILMGKQAEGKKLAGFRNGYGGKCLEGESTLFCAKRELEEELHLEENYGINVSYDEFEKIGSVTQGDKQIDFFILQLHDMIDPPTNNSEFVDTHWFDLDKPDEFVPEMLSGDDEVMRGTVLYLNTKKTFEIDKSENKILVEQTKKIYK